MFVTTLFLLFVASSVLAFRRFRIASPYSKGLLFAIGLMVTATICLAQNYTESLIPGIHDGIGIANPFAYLIIGEDGWSVQTFRSYFHGAVIATLALVAAYPLIIVLESRKKQRSHS